MIDENHDKYLPLHNNHTHLCTAIVEVLAWLRVPDNLNEFKKYHEDLVKIREFLKMICKTESFESTENISLTCFKTLCSILLSDDREKEPSSALVIVLQLVEEQLWKQHMDVAVKHFVDYSRDELIIKMLVLFCRWLAQPPCVYMEYLSMWLTLFMKGLENADKINIPAEVAESVLDDILCDCLNAEKFYAIKMKDSVILYLLMTIRSLTAHHSVMKTLDFFMTKWSKTGMNKNMTVLNLMRIAYTLLDRFSHHTNENSCNICEKVAQQIQTLANGNSQNFTTRIPEDSEAMDDQSYPSTSSGGGNGQSRLSSAKCGLSNLGNTCYMNSVLQALAMTRQFCCEVLLYKSTNDLGNQAVLKNLRNLFALLKYSARNSLAPTEILRASRPAYFMPGQQQDSSEFLWLVYSVVV